MVHGRKGMLITVARYGQGKEGKEGKEGQGQRQKEMALNFHIIGVSLRHHTIACSEWLHQ
jgi:hypothetical protein